LGAAAAAAELVLLEATAIGPAGAVCVAGSHAAAAVARSAGVPVWLVGGVGRLLPARMWDALVRRLDEAGDPWEADDEVVPLALVDLVCGPGGPEPVADALRRTACPVAPELFRTTAF
jgi:transglutaminase-like putative cysteine protease